MLRFKQCAISNEDAEKYIQKYKNYIMRFLKRYAWLQYQDELLAEARLSIIHAVQEFDPEKGQSLDKWIKYGIANAILNERKSLWHKNKRIVLRDESFFYNYPTTKHGSLSIDNIDEVKHILSRISKDHSKILCDRFIRQLSLKQIAKQYDWSTERVVIYIYKALRSAKYKYRIKE